MNYTPRSQSIEAAPVELAGQRLMAVAVDGKAHLVDAGVFEMLFHQEEETQKIERLERVVASETRRPVKKTKSEGRRVSEVAQRCLTILREHGPLTSAELRDHVYREEKDPKKRLQNFSALSLDMRKRGMVERRTDMQTHLEKWHIVGEV